MRGGWISVPWERYKLEPPLTRMAFCWAWWWMSRSKPYWKREAASGVSNNRWGPYESQRGIRCQRSRGCMGNNCVGGMWPSLGRHVAGRYGGVDEREGFGDTWALSCCLGVFESIARPGVCGWAVREKVSPAGADGGISQRSCRSSQQEKRRYAPCGVVFMMVSRAIFV